MVLVYTTLASRCMLKPDKLRLCRRGWGSLFFSKRSLTTASSLACLSTWAALALIFSLAGAVSAEQMTCFNADIAINADDSLDVHETLNMDFQGDDRHGIIRTIPKIYVRKGESFSVDLKLVSVTDEAGRPIHYVVHPDGWDEQINVGESDKLGAGKETYKIHYQVRRAINWFNNAPEFYWNVTGRKWHYPILRTTARVYFPQYIALTSVALLSFVGGLVPNNGRAAKFCRIVYCLLAVGSVLARVWSLARDCLPAASSDPARWMKFAGGCQIGGR